MATPRDELIPTRATLLHRLKNWDDQASWQEFFDTYWKLIYGVARKAGLTDADAQDVVQETMKAVARHMPGFTYNPALGSFKGWLLQMTRWRIIDVARKRSPADVSKRPRRDDETRTDTVMRLVDPSSNQLDELWDAEWRQTLLEAGLQRIKKRVKPLNYQLFDFHVLKQWPVEQVAGRFGVKASDIHMAKHRIGEMLEEEIRRLAREAP